MRPQLPRRIHVGPMRYRISASTDSIRVLAQEGAVGLTSPDECTIWVSPDIAEERRPSIVLHEVIHACADLAGLGDNCTEEDWAARLAPALLDVLRRNPDLVRYLIGGDQ